MSEEKKVIDDGGPAFPVFWNQNTPGELCALPGVTRRQWLAGLAMQGLLANPETWKIGEVSFQDQAYHIADAMIQFEKSEAGK